MSFDAKLFSGIGVFAAVADTGNFTNADAALGITASGVSRAISWLGQRVGPRLFERSPRAVVLTEEAQLLYNRVKPMLEEAEAAATDLVTGRSVVTGRLRIAADAPSSQRRTCRRFTGATNRLPETQRGNRGATYPE